MGRRIDIELTSKVDDDTWTWRVAGAKQPRGTVHAKLLYEGCKVGDVVRAEVEDDIEGIVVTLVTPPKKKRAEPERLEILAPVERRPPAPPPPRPAKPERGPRPAGRDRDRDRERSAPPRGGDRARPDRRMPRAARSKPEPVPERPKPKRLNPGHTHRNDVLASLPPEQRPIAEQLLRGGIPAVRQAIDTQIAVRKTENQSPIKAEPLLALAEELLPALKAAEWRDRADAALLAGDDISLRDLRSVVSSAEARDDETRVLARTLRDTLDVRLKSDRETWLTDIGDALGATRVVRALRIASRPPDPAMRFPAELGARLAEAASTAMGPEAPPDRWLAVLDAVSVSPVRRAVKPAGLPSQSHDEFLATVKAQVQRVPALGPLVGVEPPQPPPKPPKPLPPKPLPQRRPPGAAAAPEPPAEPATPEAVGGTEGDEPANRTEEPVPAADT